MFSPITGLYWPETKRRPAIETHHQMIMELIGIEPDGDAAIFAISNTSHAPILVRIGIEEIGPILHEIRIAALAMMDRQALKIDRGLGKLLEVARHALCPIDLQVWIEPATADRIWLLQFSNHAPLGIRQSPEAVDDAKLSLADAEAASLH